SSALSLHRSVHVRALASFPTRRSSDLVGSRAGDVVLRQSPVEGMGERKLRQCLSRRDRVSASPERPAPPLALHWKYAVAPGEARSEEHTSELQSLTNLVCRLLLEKQKS